MTQTASFLTRTGIIQVEMPSPDEPLIGNVHWGAYDVFPMPAYWQYQVVVRRLGGRPASYRLGRTLAEEVAACLLGGHGIPATVGLAAYGRLHERGAFGPQRPSQATIEEWLKEPLQMKSKEGTRQVRYRFAAQKARFLAAALPEVQSPPAFETGRQLRNWLTRLPGVGPKTASWIARNWKDADDVAILDIHIMRVGQVLGLFPRELTVERHYVELEDLFLEFSDALGVRASELDAVIWYEMASSPKTARAVIEQLEGERPAVPPCFSPNRPRRWCPPIRIGGHLCNPVPDPRGACTAPISRRRCWPSASSPAHPWRPSPWRTA